MKVFVAGATGVLGRALVLWDAVVGNRRRRRASEREARHASAAAEVERLCGRELRLNKTVAARERMEDPADAEIAQLLDELEQLEERELPDAREAEADAKRALDHPPRPDRSERFLQYAIGGVPMLLAQALILFEAWHALDVKQAALLVAVARSPPRAASCACAPPPETSRRRCSGCAAGSRAARR